MEIKKSDLFTDTCVFILQSFGMKLIVVFFLFFKLDIVINVIYEKVSWVPIVLVVHTTILSRVRN